MTEALVRSRIFGKDDKPTIYYIVGFRMKIKQFEVHIRALTLAGFRVVAFDSNPAVLTKGNPELLAQAMAQFLTIIKADVQGRTIAGAYGISLGSFFALNVLALPEVPRAALNTGGGSILQAVWEMDVLGWVKQKYVDKGFSRSDVGKAWNPVDISQNTHKIAGKSLLAAASYADEFVPIDDALRHYKEWQEDGVKAQLDIYKHLKHKQLIILNLLRIGKTAKFFKS